METRRRLKKVGGSVMLAIPAEIAAELGLEAESEVRVSSEEGAFRVEPLRGRPPEDVARFMARFTEKYDEALRNLAER